MTQEINRRLHEALGRCWHEIVRQRMNVINSKDECYQQQCRNVDEMGQKIAALQAEIAELKGIIKLMGPLNNLDITRYEIGLKAHEISSIKRDAAGKYALEWQHRCMQVDMELSTAKARIKELEGGKE